MYNITQMSENALVRWFVCNENEFCSNSLLAAILQFENVRQETK